MNDKLNIQPQTITYGVVSDLLNGSFDSLSGPVGFVPTQPRIGVRRIELTNVGSSLIQVYLFKGPSGGNSTGDQILAASIPSESTVAFDVDLVLDSEDFLTGACHSSGSVVVNIAAGIGF